jgi:hypothetical protein
MLEKFGPLPLVKAAVESKRALLQKSRLRSKRQSKRQNQDSYAVA